MKLMDATQQLIEFQNQIESLIWIIGLLTVIGTGFTIYINKRMSTLADIDQKLESLDNLETIEKRLTHAIKEIEHNFWQKQQIDQVRRERLEELMTIMLTHTDMVDQITKCLMVGEEPPSFSPNKKSSLLVNLYFPELKDDDAIHFKAQSNYMTSLAALSKEKPNFTPNDVREIHNVYMKFWRDYTKKIYEYAEDLTYYKAKSPREE